MKLALGLWLAVAGFAFAAKLDFAETSKVVHAPADAVKVSTEFSFTNKGDKPVTIEKADGGCSCMTTSLSGGKMTYAPGESGTIRADFDMGNFTGEVDKVIAVWVKGDQPESPSFQLKVHVAIPVIVQIEPKTLKWEVGAEPKAQRFKITINDDKPVKILSVTVSNPLFAYELKTLEEGKSYEFR